MSEPATSAVPAVMLRVAEARVEDIAHAIARVAPADLARIGAKRGDIVKLTGRTTAVARVDVADADRGGIVQIDGTIRSNCGAALDEPIAVAPAESAQAVAVRLAPVLSGGAAPIVAPERLLEDLVGVPIVAGCAVRIPTFAKAVNFQVIRTIPSGTVVIGPRTDIRIVEGEQTAANAPAVSYEDIGGLERELARIRELVELPLKHARLFERLGILAPKGVLLYGPPGTGKTLLARAVAAESRVHFIHLNGPEIMRKFYGESEARLRELFEEAARRAPAILFIDEIDAVAPKRADVAGEVEKRVVAQLLSLMDGFVSRGQVIVMGATNLPEVLDPALRRPGRFDREIEIGVPNTQGRLQILRIHTRAMPLGPDVNLAEIAEHSHGFVGADLEALCQEVGMITLRKYLSAVRLGPDATGNTVRLKPDTTETTVRLKPDTTEMTVRLKPDTTGTSGDTVTDGASDVPVVSGFSRTVVDDDALVVTREDFLAGLGEVEPSATREFYIEKSTTTFASIGGLDEVKRVLGGLVERSRADDELYEQIGLTPPRGVLLAGPSGSGKTAMARALSGEKQLPLIAVDGPQLYSKWFGESEKALRDVFKKARRAAPCVLFFDNVDALAPRNAADTTGGGVHQRLLSQLLREIDNLRDVRGVLLLAATDRPERVEPALLRSGRFDYVLQFEHPDASARAAILCVCCRQMPLASDVVLDELATRAERFSGADLEALCKKAALIAIADFQHGLRGGRFVVRRSDFDAVFAHDGPAEAGHYRNDAAAAGSVRLQADRDPGSVRL